MKLTPTRAPSTGSSPAYSTPAACSVQMQCQLARPSLEPSMDRRRALAAKVDDHGDADDPADELGVFAAERYFYGDDDALWCERSSSSLSSSAFRTGTLEHDRSVVPTPTAATTSSEASWNSRSDLLRNNEPPPPAAKLRAATPVAGAEPVLSRAESERAGHRRASSSSNLRRWLLGCACGGGDGEESVSADKMEGSDDVLGVGDEKCNTVASDLCPRTEVFPKRAFEEPTVATVRPGSGRWLLGDDQVLAGRDSFSPIEIARHGHRRDANSGEMSDERRRTKSLENFRALSDDRGNTLGSGTQSSGFTIVAGNGYAPPRAVAGGGGGGGKIPGGEDDDAAAAASEVGCAYPPSEASVVWSVVTADGAASGGNFSSAASGYYHHHYYFTSYGEDGAAKGGRRRRRSGIATASSLLACVSDKAVDAVGPVHGPEVEQAPAVARMGAVGGSRNGRGGGYQQDVMRRREGKVGL